MSLSDRIKNYHYVDVPYVIPVKDVREAVKELKIKFIKIWNSDVVDCNLKAFQTAIDEVFGEKLI